LVIVEPYEFKLGVAVHEGGSGVLVETQAAKPL
jgi:hypothetical protein